MKDTLNQKRWLVVDDEPSVLKMTAQVLRTVPGSDVVACDGPRTALEVFFAKPESFELVVTDFNMPGLDGIELARAVHERAPQVKVVMVTGSGLENANGRSGDLHALLPKPFMPSALVQTVLAVLSGSSSHKLT